MATLKAPYNFAPLSDRVFFPEWADQISMDIPFSDGISGSIDLNIKALTPIFVRNGHSKQDGENKNDTYKSFSKAPDGRYFIPATSIKGEIRDVLEILSCGKLGKDRFKNQSFGIRDLSSGVDGKFYRSKITTDNIRCGWMTKKGDSYSIDDKGIPWRISPEEIDAHLGTELDGFVKGDNFTSDENKTAKKKYDLCSQKGTGSLRRHFTADDRHSKKHLVLIDEDGWLGTIVLTGQPSKAIKSNGKWTNKYFEFVFPEDSENAKIKLSADDSVIKSFISINADAPDYKDFRKDQLEKGDRIPVFFMKGKDGNVESIGLSYMYKYPAYNSIYSAVPLEYLFSKHDLADCIFGYTSNNESMRGRVWFSHAFATNSPNVLGERKIVLSTPHPSYYPTYLGNGKTWNSEDARIAGRKRYPTRNKLSESPEGSADMETTMIPLDKGTEFCGKIVFNNLRPVELGALLAAISFNAHPECHHNLGYAKPLGYGKIEMDYKLDIDDQAYDANSLISTFDNKMKQENNNWEESPTVIELLKMAEGIPEGQEDSFKYMKMSTDSNSNEFKAGKEAYSNGEQLGLFSQILNDNVPQVHFSGNVSVNKERIDIEKVLKEKEERIRKEEETRKEEEERVRQEEEARKKEEERRRAEEQKKKEIDANNKIIQDYIRAGDELKGDKKYSEAIAKYNEAKKYLSSIPNEGIIYVDIDSKIEQCNNMLSKKGSSIQDSIGKITSIGALSGNIKKWIDAGNSFSEEEVGQIASLIKSFIQGLKPHDKKDWLDFKKWNKLSNVLGEETTKKIFNKVIK